MASDATSRRAFALDSRTVWVEQQLVHGTLLARDNLPLGPGEYTPDIQAQARHVCTPVFGRPRDQASYFPSFNSPTARRARAASPTGAPHSPVMSIYIPKSVEQQGKLQRLQSPTQSQLRHLQENSTTIDERSEFKTIFHESEKRDPFDTNRRYCVTPGPYLAHDSVLETVKNDGKYVVRGAIPFGPNNVPFGARAVTKNALPTYDVNYDSKYVRPVPKLGSFPKDKRIDIPQGSEWAGEGDDETPLILRNRSVSPSNIIPSQLSPGQAGMRSIAELRCSLVKLPKVKRRPITKMEFDDSSYHKGRKQTVLNVTPSLMRSEIKDRVFDKLMAIPRAHKAPGLKISLKGDHDI